MRLWRISDFFDLEGTGGVKASARWHNKGRPILYAAESPVGALIEIIVHLDPDNLPFDLQLLEIEIGDDASVDTIEQEKLSSAWRDDINETRMLGDDWLLSGHSLVLRVPSVICPRTWNYLLNPNHRDAPAMRIVPTERFPFDGRLK